jgi:hypothetical protein
MPFVYKNAVEILCNYVAFKRTCQDFLIPRQALYKHAKIKGAIIKFGKTPSLFLQQ